MERRHSQKYIAVPSPLKSLRFYRLLMDEIQLVEGNLTSNYGLDQIQSIYRWCISGTPFKNNNMDLYQLLSLLNVPFLSDKSFYQGIIEVSCFLWPFLLFQRRLQFQCRLTMSYLNEFIFKYIYRSNNTQMASLPSQYYIYHKYIFNDIEVCWFCSLFGHE